MNLVYHRPLSQETMSILKANLKQEKLNFSKNIKITAPAEVFKSHIVIESTIGELDKDGKPAEWTTILIKDKITLQE